MSEEGKSRADQLAALGIVIAGKRKEAIEARKTSGIESVWLACEEAYLGIDDANRHEFKDAKWAKPTSMTGGLVEESSQTDDSRSTAFVRLTSRYVDAGTAKLGEILLPPGERAFSFGPTPVPDLIEAEKDDRPAVVNGAPMAAPPAPVDPMAPPAALDPAAAPAPAAPAPVLTIADLVAQVIADATEKAEKAENRVYDWMVEAGWHGQNRKIIFDSGRIGVGVLKAPFPERKKVQAIVREAGVVVLKSKTKIRPGAKWVDPWNVFPDPACGENIHDGDFIFERDFLAKSKLEDLKRTKGYISEQIDKVVEEGPNKANQESPNPNEKEAKGRFEVWYFYGRLTRKEMLAANADISNADKEKNDFYAIVTMVNESVVRATVNPLDSGKFPFYAMPWSRRAGSWAGVGIAEQVSMPQRICNASLRALLNNAGLSGGVQVLMDRDSIEPAVGNDWRLLPNKVWIKVPGAPIDDMQKAFAMLTYPNLGPQLAAILELGQKQAEEATSIPLVTQGQTGPTTPETLGQSQQQENNANTLLRAIGYAYDEHITDPAVHAFYEWLLLDQDVPDDEKGDFEISAQGSVALVERAIQEQTLAAMGQMVLNPVFGVDPKKWFAEWMKSKRLNPEKMQYSKEEQKTMAETPPAEPVPVMVAKINTASAEKIAGLDAEQGAQAAPGAPEVPDTSTVDAAQIRANTELEKVRENIADAQADRLFDAEQADKQRAHQLRMKEIDLEMKRLDREQAGAVEQARLEHDSQITLDKSKVELAKTTITDETKRELADKEVQLARDLEGVAGIESPSIITDSIVTPGTP